MKRGSLWLLAAVLTGALLTVTVSAATVYPLGDLDFDGETKASDLTALARAVGGVEALVNEGYAKISRASPLMVRWKNGTPFPRCSDGIPSPATTPSPAWTAP